MSSTTIAKPAQTGGHAAAPGIYLAFAPWVVFSLLTEHSTLRLATVGALLTSIAIAARSLRRGRPKALEIAAAVTFAAFAAVAFVADPAVAAFLARYARAVAAGALSAIAFSSLLVVPFTEQYARESVPRQTWSSPPFRQVNRQLSAMWGLVFAAMVPAHVLAGTIDTHRANLIFNWGVPILLIGWAIRRTAAVSERARA